MDFFSFEDFRDIEISILAFISDVGFLFLVIGFNIFIEEEV